MLATALQPVAVRVSTQICTCQFTSPDVAVYKHVPIPRVVRLEAQGERAVVLEHHNCKGFHQVNDLGVFCKDLDARHVPVHAKEATLNVSIVALGTREKIVCHGRDVYFAHGRGDQGFVASDGIPGDPHMPNEVLVWSIAFELRQNRNFAQTAWQIYTSMYTDAKYVYMHACI